MNGDRLIQAAKVLYDEFMHPASVSLIDVGCDAASDVHSEGDVGNSNDCIEAFLRAIATTDAPTAQ